MLRVSTFVVLGVLAVASVADRRAVAAMGQAGQKEAKGSGRALKFETYADTKGEARWRLKATNGQVIATSGQGYKNKGDCEHAIDVIKKGAKQAKVDG